MRLALVSHFGLSRGHFPNQYTLGLGYFDSFTDNTYDLSYCPVWKFASITTLLVLISAIMFVFLLETRFSDYDHNQIEGFSRFWGYFVMNMSIKFRNRVVDVDLAYGVNDR